VREKMTEQKTANGPLYTKINDDIKVAMKAKEKERLQALRYMKSMLMENTTSKKPIPEMDVIVKHHKKLKDGLTTFPAEHPMHTQTIAELEVVGAYLPQQLSVEEVTSLINSIKGALESPNMGAIMKELQPKIKG
jgi:uncharacterized protein YqeY